MALMRRSALALFSHRPPLPSSDTFLHMWRYRSQGQLRLCSCSAPTKHENPGPPTTSECDPLPDHRAIAASQQLLITSPYSPGSPLFLPHGTHVYNKLVSFIRSQYTRYGFQEVLSPNIYKRTLWEISGHWENYKDDMFEVTGRGASGARDENATPGNEEGYGLKPMNCPGHCLLFKATTGGRPIGCLPVRYADFSPLHRNENTGSLSGLTRVRRFHQDDGHIFCRPSQITQEIASTLEFIETVHEVFHLPTPQLVLSTRPENSIGSLDEWDRAEAALKEALGRSGHPWKLNEGDGAFYGPKIDVVLQDSNGKKHQTGTIQLDFQLPRRFELSYLAPAPELEQKGVLTDDPEQLKLSGHVTPVLIHRAVLGSLERFMALLIEHYHGKWPFWLSPRQAIVIPVTVTDEIVAFARQARRTMSGLLHEHDGDQRRPLPLSRRTFRVDVDESSNSLSKKIRAAKTSGYTHVVIVGEKNVASGTVSVDAGRFSGTISVPGSEFVKSTKSFEMTAAEVYDHFRRLEDDYA